MSQKDSPQNVPHNNATERRRSDIDQNNKKTFVGAAGESFKSLRAPQQTLPLTILITLVLHFMYMGQPLPLSVKYDMAAGAKVHQNIV